MLDFWTMPVSHGPGRNSNGTASVRVSSAGLTADRMRTRTPGTVGRKCMNDFDFARRVAEAVAGDKKERSERHSRKGPQGPKDQRVQRFRSWTRPDGSGPLDLWSLGPSVDLKKHHRLV